MGYMFQMIFVEPLKWLHRTPNPWGSIEPRLKQQLKEKNVFLISRKNLKCKGIYVFFLFDRKYV